MTMTMALPLFQTTVCQVYRMQEPQETRIAGSVQYGLRAVSVRIRYMLHVTYAYGLRIMQLCIYEWTYCTINIICRICTWVWNQHTFTSVNETWVDWLRHRNQVASQLRKARTLQIHNPVWEAGKLSRSLKLTLMNVFLTKKGLESWGKPWF